MTITIKKIHIVGDIEVSIIAPDIKSLEEYRLKIAETYRIDDQKPFVIDFVVQTDNFDEIAYNKHKRKK